MKPELRKNVVHYEYFLPDPQDEERTLKAVYNPIIANSTLVKEINKAKEMHAKGEVDTLVLDNLTYLSRNKWLHITKFEQQFSKQGNLNTEAMYGTLGNWLYELFQMYVMTFKGNLVVNAHLLKEGEEAMEKKMDKTIEYEADVLGGFRQRVKGLFSNFFCLEKMVDNTGKARYFARTDKGAGKFAKNRFNLPTIIENPSYQTIEKAINEAMGNAMTKEVIK